MGVSDPGEPAQLNGTNNPFGLIICFSVSPSLQKRGDGKQRRSNDLKQNSDKVVAAAVTGGRIPKNLYVDIKESVDLRVECSLTEVWLGAVDLATPARSRLNHQRRRFAPASLRSSEEPVRLGPLVIIAQWHHPFPFRTRQ